MENVEIKKEEKPMEVIKEESTQTAGDLYAERLNKKKSKDEKKTLKAFMEKRNAARAAQKLAPAYTKEQIEKACK